MTKPFEFDFDPDTESEEIERLVSQTVRSVALSFFRQAVLITPVDTGRARAGWQIDVQGQRGGIEVLFGIPAFILVTVSNPVEYVIYLDQGSSQQAPDGIVDVALSAAGIL